MPIVLDGTNGITQADQFNSDSTFGFKNRIINGAMVLNQRNTTISASDSGWQYAVDRWAAFQSISSSKFTLAGSSTAPTGFTNSLLATSSSAYTLSASEFFTVRQPIEGFNSAFGWGTANAQEVTLSFWVRSSVTGTFAGFIQNANDGSRTYPFTYTISLANTFEYKTITIDGDTSGTWLTNNGAGPAVCFSMGCGSTYLGTADAWTGSTIFGVTGQTNLVATNGATWFVTGVQLEVGSTATGFDYRSIGTELALCQRYFQRRQLGFNGVAGTGAILYTQGSLPVAMRANPAYSATGAITITDIFSQDHTQSSTQIQVWQSISSDVPVTVASVSMGNFSGLTQGRAYFLTPSQSIFLSSEL